MSNNASYRGMRKEQHGKALIFCTRIDKSNYGGPDKWVQYPPDAVAIFSSKNAPGGVVCFGRWCGVWIMRTGERYAIAELIKALSKGVELLGSLAEISHYLTSHRDKAEYEETLGMAWPFLKRWEKREPFDKAAYEEFIQKKLEEIKQQEND